MNDLTVKPADQFYSERVTAWASYLSDLGEDNGISLTRLRKDDVNAWIGDIAAILAFKEMAYAGYANIPEVVAKMGLSLNP